MLWATLWRKLGRQPLKITQHNHVYALLKNPKTHEYDHVPLCLKFDTSGPSVFRPGNRKESLWQHQAQTFETKSQPFLTP